MVSWIGLLCISNYKVHRYKFHISSPFEKFSKHERNGWNMVKVLRHDQSRNREGKYIKEYLAFDITC